MTRARLRALEDVAAAVMRGMREDVEQAETFARVQRANARYPDGQGFGGGPLGPGREPGLLAGPPGPSRVPPPVPGLPPGGGPLGPGREPGSLAGIRSFASLVAVFMSHDESPLKVGHFRGFAAITIRARRLDPLRALRRR